MASTFRSREISYRVYCGKAYMQASIRFEQWVIQGDNTPHPPAARADCIPKIDPAAVPRLIRVPALFLRQVCFYSSFCLQKTPPRLVYILFMPENNNNNRHATTPQPFLRWLRPNHLKKRDWVV